MLYHLLQHLPIASGFRSEATSSPLECQISRMLMYIDICIFTSREKDIDIWIHKCRCMCIHASGYHVYIYIYIYYIYIYYYIYICIDTRHLLMVDGSLLDDLSQLGPGVLAFPRKTAADPRADIWMPCVCICLYDM